MTVIVVGVTPTSVDCRVVVLHTSEVVDAFGAVVVSAFSPPPTLLPPPHAAASSTIDTINATELERFMEFPLERRR